MLPGVNIEEIKKYNESIKGYKEKSNRLSAEIEINTRELNSLCDELTAELGIQVTVDNVESIYNDKMTNILETIKSGKEIIARIEQEIASQDTEQKVDQSGITVPQTPVGVGATQPTTPQNITSSPEIQQPVFGASANQGQTIFSGDSARTASPFGDLPPIFSK